MARLSSELILSLDDRVSGPARNVHQSLNRLSSSTASTVSRINGMAVATAGVLAAAGVGIAAKETVSAAADFESALTEIQKKAGISAEATAKLGEEIKALATDGSLAVPISDIAAAYERGAAAGIPVDKLRDFASLSVKAADAFGMSAEDVGNFAAKLQTSLGQTNEEIRKTFDLTNSLADAGIADESAIVDFVDRTGASLKSLGLTMPQTLAVGATMLNLGMTADVAATSSDALARKMQLVGTLTGKSRKSFEKVMGPVGRFSKLVEKDANGALLSLLDHIKELNGEDRAAFLQDFVGAEHSGKVLRLAEAVGEVRRNLALANDESKWLGSLDASYKLKLDDFWSQWQLVKSSLEKLAIDAGNIAMPGLKAGLTGAQELVAAIGKGLKDLEVQIDWTAVDGARKAIGEAGDELGRLLNIDTSGSSVQKFFNDLAKAINDVAAAARRTAKEVKDITAFLRDPLGEMTRQRTVEEEERWGVKRTPQDVLDRAMPEKIGRENKATGDRDRSMNDFLDGNGLAPPDTTPAASKAPRLRRPAGTMQLPDLNYPTAPPRGLAIPIPTPRPDIAGPIQLEGDKAAQAAEAAGQRIQQAFSVTVTPEIDATSIRSATADADALLRKLAQIGPAATRAARAVSDAAASAASASGRTSRVDYDGLQADTTHTGF